MRSFDRAWPSGNIAGLMGVLFLLSATLTQAQVSSGNTSDSTQGEVRARYLGVTGWEITDGKTHILIDPYLSRLPGPPADGGTGGPGWPGKLRQEDSAVPDTAAIDRYIDRANYILLTHAHYVHMLDTPYIARTRKAVIIGNQSVANIARDYGIPNDQIITIRGGEDFDFGAFSVRVLPSLHSFASGKHYSNPGIAPADAKWPLRFRDFVEGGVFAYLIRLNGVQIVAFGSMNYIEREVAGLHPDVALVAADPMRKEIYDYTGRLLRALNFPPLVVATHWDWSQLPFDASFEKQLKNADEFTAEVHAVSSQSRVIIPRHFEWIKFSQ
jgi:L-ascorbate metabolism protein UlaG (beta-lactamase superfamily)